jgi:hypothetical protein
MAYSSQVALLDYSNLTSTAEVVSSSSPLELRCLSALQLQRYPFFHRQFPDDVPKALPYPWKAPRSGFGYPLRGVSYAALGSLFQLPALLGFSLQSFSPYQGSKKRFHLLSTLLRFPTKPSRASHRRFSVLIPLEKPRPSTSTPND